MSFYYVDISDDVFKCVICEYDCNGHGIKTIIQSDDCFMQKIFICADCVKKMHKTIINNLD